MQPLVKIFSKVLASDQISAAGESTTSLAPATKRYHFSYSQK